MNKEQKVLSVVSVETKPPTMDGVRFVIRGQDDEEVTLDMPSSGLLAMSVLIDQLALDVETARLLGKTAPDADINRESERLGPGIAPVHVARTFQATKVANGGVLLDVSSVRGESFVLSISAEQAVTLLLSLVPTPTSGAQ